MTRRRSQVVAALAATCLLIAGCSDSEGNAAPTTEPSPEPTATTEEPTSPGPGPTPWPEPTRPEAMERDDVEGAKAAAQYFLELYPYVYVTGDLRAWNEMAHPECEFCEGVAENVEELHSDGGYADGPMLEFVSVDAQAPTEEYEYFAVRIEAVEHPSSRFDESGTVLGSQEGGPLDADLALQHGAGVWSVRGAVVTPREGTEGR